MVQQLLRNLGVTDRTFRMTEIMARENITLKKWAWLERMIDDEWNKTHDKPFPRDIQPDPAAASCAEAATVES